MQLKIYKASIPFKNVVLLSGTNRYYVHPLIFGCLANTWRHTIKDDLANGTYDIDI